jgi:hypothetical protein
MLHEESGGGFEIALDSAISKAEKMKESLIIKTIG